MRRTITTLAKTGSGATVLTSDIYSTNLGALGKSAFLTANLALSPRNADKLTVVPFLFPFGFLPIIVFAVLYCNNHNDELSLPGS